MPNISKFGDCYELIKTIQDNSIDLVLTDPPYCISKDSNFKKNSLNKKFNNISIDFGDWDKTKPNLELLFKEFHRCLKSGGQVIIFYDIWKSSELKEISEKFGFKQPRVCQWVKTNPVPINSKKNYLSNSVEYFFTFVKGSKPTFNSQYDRGIYNYPICHGLERLKHPTQKPIKLISDLIKKHSEPGDLILDPFGGVGTTAAACIELNRNYVIFENNIEYFHIMESRLKNETLLVN